METIEIPVYIPKEPTTKLPAALKDALAVQEGLSCPFYYAGVEAVEELTRYENINASEKVLQDTFAFAHDSEWVLILDSDVVLHMNSLREVYDWAVAEKKDAVAIHTKFVRMGDMDHVCCAALLLKRALWQKVDYMAMPKEDPCSAYARAYDGLCYHPTVTAGELGHS